MITATAVKYPDGTVGLFTDPVRAELHAAQAHATAHELVEKAAILRKFDGYVPADVASELRWCIRELEAQVAALQRVAGMLADERDSLERRVGVEAAFVGGQVITDPAKIEALFAADTESDEP